MYRFTRLAKTTLTVSFFHGMFDSTKTVNACHCINPKSFTFINEKAFNFVKI